MTVPQLHIDDYRMPGLEFSGSYFTSVKFLSAQHCHDFFELCLVTAGSLTHVCNGRREELRSGQLLFIRPDDVHYFESARNQYFQFINLAIASEVIYDLLQYLGKGFKPERFLHTAHPLSVEVPKSEMESLKALLDPFVITPPLPEDMLCSSLRATLITLLNQYFPLKLWENKTSVPLWLGWLHTEMQRRENFVGGIPTMHKLACKSPEHLSREFKKHFNMTPTVFINDTRLNFARNLLTYSDEKVIDIAFSSGFQNLSHFCHEFKKKYDMTPSDYRKNHQKLIGTELEEQQ